MIAVVGEALIDLVGDHDGRLDPQPGGGPFNAARTMGRLGLAPAFLGRLSTDGFGGLLRASLAQDGVILALPEPVDVPSTLAAVDVNASGAASYSFYLAGTSACAVDYPVLRAAVPDGVTALHAGSLALVMDPIATSIERLIVSDLPSRALVMIDPNCRPAVIADHQAYRSRLSRILLRADVVKASVEDLAYLFPGESARAAAAALLDQGPVLVLVTDGARPARALLAGQELTVDVPAVRVVDTIGAGDAFGAAFLGWWSGNALARDDLHRADRVQEALRAAAEVAALTCTRVGAEPPRLAELRGSAGWPSDPRTWRAPPLPGQPDVTSV